MAPIILSNLTWPDLLCPGWGGGSSGPATPPPCHATHTTSTTLCSCPPGALMAGETHQHSSSRLTENKKIKDKVKIKYIWWSVSTIKINTNSNVLSRLTDAGGEPMSGNVSPLLESTHLLLPSGCLFMLTHRYVTPCKLHTDGLHTLAVTPWAT